MPVPEYLACICRRQLRTQLVCHAAQQRADHGARKSEQAAQTEEISDESGGKRHADRITGAEQDRAEYVYHMLYGRALRAEHRDGKQAADNSNSNKHACDGQFTDVFRFHFDSLLLKIRQKWSSGPQPCPRPGA